MPDNNKSKYFLYAEGVKKQYYSNLNRHRIMAVNNVSLGFFSNEIYGLVGESGCGKSTFTRVLIGIEEPTEGNIYYKGKNIKDYTKRERTNVRRNMQMVFQDPYSCVNPRMTIREIIQEPLCIHHIGSRNEQYDRVKELIDMVGISSSYLDKYPHQLSGGQRQRVCIARALALSPSLIVCDEAVSALDVSVQAQILNLLKSLKHELEISIVFVSHDLAAVGYVSDRIGVMYGGRIVEEGSREDIILHPSHPYSKVLFSSVPRQGDSYNENVELWGEVSTALPSKEACPISNRCPYACEQCQNKVPVLSQIGENHLVACHMANV